ncbi:YceI family protein [Sphingomonas sp. ID0503]|uniref:YceI family protein n=1 Tax=Sphingomonas sp. ID0503 TaxID=3399691 RepID=UPI003AFA6658
MRAAFLALGIAIASPLPALAQMPTEAPGKADPARVEAGTYKVDPHHTQVIWKVDHMGVSPLWGAFGDPAGSLTLDPKNPAAAKLSLTFPLTGLTVTSAPFLKHLSGTDFFDVAKFPQATFVSTSVKASGTKATVTGNLTIKGITKPVVIEAEFYGAGPNPMSKKLNIGFKGMAKVKRSDFGLGYGVPMVGDEVELKIAGAFEKE